MNRNRGYQQLRVWKDAIEHYRLACQVFRAFPYDLKRVASQAIASSDSLHRNIAEGYCRRSRKEYLNFLNYALASLGEFVSGLMAYVAADQISQASFEQLDALSFKIENGLLKLVESLRQTSYESGWDELSVVKESNATYETI